MDRIGRRHFLTSVAALSLSACAGPAKSAGAAQSIDITTAPLGQGEAAASGMARFQADQRRTVIWALQNL